LGGLKRF